MAKFDKKSETESLVTSYVETSDEGDNLSAFSGLKVTEKTKSSITK